MEIREGLLPGWSQFRWSAQMLWALGLLFVMLILFLVAQLLPHAIAGVAFWVFIAAFVWLDVLVFGRTIKRAKERRAGYTTLPPDKAHPELDEVDPLTGIVIRRGIEATITDEERGRLLDIARGPEMAALREASSLPSGWPKRLRKPQAGAVGRSLTRFPGHLS